jgi:hypothetical protein
MLLTQPVYSKATCRTQFLDGMIVLLRQVCLIGEPRGIPSYVLQLVFKKEPDGQSWPSWIFFS